MCDSEESTINYFHKHLELMRKLKENNDYESVADVKDFFIKLKEVTQLEN